MMSELFKREYGTIGDAVVQWERGSLNGLSKAYREGDRRAKIELIKIARSLGYSQGDIKLQDKPM